MTGSAQPDGAERCARPAQRLRASRDIRAVFAARRAVASPVAVVHTRPRSDGGSPRITVVAGKSVGNAVRRNRAKRRIRAAVAGLDLHSATDYVFVARSRALTAPWTRLQAELTRSVARTQR